MKKHLETLKEIALGALVFAGGVSLLYICAVLA